MNNSTNRPFYEDNDILAEINVQLDILENVLDKGAVKARISKHKLQKHLAGDTLSRAYAVNKIASDGMSSLAMPREDDLVQMVEDTNKWISEIIARNYVQRKVEEEVEKELMDKQDKYIDEMRLNVLRKKKGPENAKTRKKFEELLELDQKHLSKNLQALLRPEQFDEIIGQERAVKSLLSKISSPYPQHIILYGPPGVGKTTAARIALNEAKKLSFTPYEEDAKFVEVNGTTLRWDPREITNPLLGSVHDPIYQGSKRDLAEGGIPEPKLGLVTEAHGGVLFIDEIGELDEILQNKLLKVLEDKRVEFSSAYYDPDDDNTPQYVKYLFDRGAPADFVLIGATTREPGDISPALRSRCTEVFFEPLTSKDIVRIVEDAAEKLQISLEEGAAELISSYTIEGRKAINLLADAYGAILYEGRIEEDKRITVMVKDVEEIIKIARIAPYEIISNDNEWEVGHIYGLAVSGFVGSTLEIETMVYESKQKGKGVVRFNDTAGSMAKDSVFNAASVIRKITGKDMSDYDIHVNVIGGAKIDGPSAGAAITVCIISALLNRPIRQDTAITGEISIRGKVKPVGGIFEKVYGARRKGIKHVIVPYDNRNDVPTGMEDITVTSVKDIEELLEIVLQ
ncbi:Lon family ATP-dependent protease [Proteiniclasticum sp. SCR006]|uniref:endopeptidase La n=1 Tax=Proteiniclasticum aestuarii TaxID=2817862 RepID=A0A939HE41_9CLOT|nr:Lon family ATP-dependent protease [Proteiniclasticum aestuarii]MBO1265628.1 Lon family ATP-dependent protease [Proteiniclasticum aestuarii]